MNEVNFDTASENAGDNKIDVLIAKNTSYWNEFHDSLLVHIEAVLRTKCNTSTVGNKQLLTNIFYGRNGSKNLDIPLREYTMKYAMNKEQYCTYEEI